MAHLIQRTVKGKTYFYFEKNIKLGPKKWKRISVYLGAKKPTKKELATSKRLLEKKEKTVVTDFYEKRLKEFKFSLLSKKELSEVERLKDNFMKRFKKLDAKEKEKFNRKQIIHFVYTTLRTEGIDVEMEDVENAYQETGRKKSRATSNKKLLISSAMITGFNFLSKIAMHEKDVLRLHGIIMSLFERHSPGEFRNDQRIIARVNPLTMMQEEINYRPPAPHKIKSEIASFFTWLAKNSDIHPLELAALVHLKMYRIHPFKDGNKRMSRLLFNKVLVDAGYPVLNISKDTKNYFKALITSVETNSDKPFALFCYKTFVKQVKYKSLK